MKIKKLIVVIPLLISFIGIAQSPKKTYDFFGGKSAINDSIVFYRLLFQIDNGVISGYAFTDEQGTQETKSIINGTFNTKTNTIVFFETKKLFTKSRTTYNNMCFLNGIVSLDLNPKISKIKGTYIENTSDGKKCNQGKIEIISMHSYQNLINEIKKETKLKKETKPTKVITNTPTFQSDEKITIKDDEEITIFWNSDRFVLDIWDDAKEDEDQITVEFNEDVILKEHILLNKKETLEFELKKGENKLIFTANNTGFIANNTARVDLFDDEIKHQIVTKLKLNKSVTVYLVRK